MTLSDYLIRDGIKPSQFARRIGVPASVVTRLVNGERGPSLETAKKIIEATNGVVSLDDMSKPVRSRQGDAA